VRNRKHHLSHNGLKTKSVRRLRSDLQIRQDEYVKNITLAAKDAARKNLKKLLKLQNDNIGAVRKFRAGKRDRGTVVFVSKAGKRLPRNTEKVGYPVYINRNGKKSAVKQYSKTSKRYISYAKAKKIYSVDIASVRSKKAKAGFFASYANPSQRGTIIAQPTTRKETRTVELVAGKKLRSATFYQRSSSLKTIAKELARAANNARGKKDFLVTIGLHVRTGGGEKFFISTQSRFSRAFKQTAYPIEVEHFLSREVYAFLAREMADRGLVLAGSARHIASQPQNKRKRRSKWTKDGFLWEGHDAQDVEITQVEYKIDQLIFGY
jgi:hypothetical protein